MQIFSCRGRQTAEGAFHGILIRAATHFLIVLILNCPQDTACFKRLEPDIQVYNEVLYDQSAALYKLEGLLANTTYEIRISYPAVIPTDFVIHVTCKDDIWKFKSRQILNIEKTVFTTDHTIEGYFAKVIAYRTGFPFNHDSLKDPIVYNIVVDTLQFGLSVKSWMMVCYTLILLIVSFKFLVPLLHHHIMTRIRKVEHQN